MKTWDDLEVWDVVRLPGWYQINQDLLTVDPHITQIDADFRRGEQVRVKALVEWTIRNPFAADYLLIRQSQWFNLHELKPGVPHQAKPSEAGES